MSPEEVKSILDTVGGLTVTGLLFLILFMGAKEKPLWVFGNVHRRALREIEIWRALALKSTNVTEQAIHKTGQALDIAEHKQKAGEVEE